MADKTFKRERNRPVPQAGSKSTPQKDAARRRVLVIVVAGLVLGAALIALTGGYRRELTTWAQDNPAGALNLILPAIAVTVVLPVLAFAWYFWRLGARTVREQRFPPAHVTWALGASPIHGAAARRRGRILQGCAAALAVVVVAFSAILIRLVLNLKSALDSRAPF
jgi:hypothetical protein